jgi:hypothetical protein
MGMKIDLSGTGVALVTPFREDTGPDYDGLRRLVRHVAEGGVDYLVVLGTTAETATLSPEEKIRIMESIWDDLCDTAGSTLSPDWHGSVLADRKAAVLAGEDEIIDWETAKRKISDELQ